MLDQIEKIEFETFYTEMKVLSDLLSATEKSLYLEKYYQHAGYSNTECAKVIQEMENKSPNKPEETINQPQPAPEQPLQTPPPPQSSDKEPNPAPNAVNQTDIQQSDPSKQDVEEPQKPKETTNQPQPTAEKNPSKQDVEEPQKPEETSSENKEEPTVPKTNWEKFTGFMKDLIHKLVEGFNKMINALFDGKKKAEQNATGESIKKIITEEQNIVQDAEDCKTAIKNLNDGSVTEESAYFYTDDYWIEMYDQTFNSDHAKMDVLDLYEEAVLNDIAKGLNSASNLFLGGDIFQGFKKVSGNVSKFADIVRNGQGGTFVKEKVTTKIAGILSGQDAGFNTAMLNMLTGGITAHTDITESWGNGTITKYVKFGPALPPDWTPTPNPNKIKAINVLKDAANKILMNAAKNGFGENLLEGRDENGELVGFYIADPNVSIDQYNDVNNPNRPKPVAIISKQDGASYGGNLPIDVINQARGFARLAKLIGGGGEAALNLVKYFGAEPPTPLFKIYEFMQNMGGDIASGLGKVFQSSDISKILPTSGAPGGKFWIYLAVDVVQKTVLRWTDKSNNENNPVDALLGALCNSLQDITGNAQRAFKTVDAQFQSAMIATISNDSEKIAEELNNIDKFFTGTGEGSIIDLVSTINNYSSLQESRLKEVQKMMVTLDTMMNDENNPIGKAFTTVSDKLGTNSLPTNENTGRTADANLFDAKEAMGDVMGHIPVPKAAFGVQHELNDRVKETGEWQEKNGLYDPNKQFVSNNHTGFTKIFMSFFQAISGLQPLLHVLLGFGGDFFNFVGAVIDGVAGMHDARLNQGDFNTTENTTNPNRLAAVANGFKQGFTNRMEQNGGIAGNTQKALDDNEHMKKTKEEQERYQSKLVNNIAGTPRPGAIY